MLRFAEPIFTPKLEFKGRMYGKKLTTCLWFDRRQRAERRLLRCDSQQSVGSAMAPLEIFPCRRATS